MTGTDVSGIAGGVALEGAEFGDVGDEGPTVALPCDAPAPSTGSCAGVARAGAGLDAVVGAAAGKVPDGGAAALADGGVGAFVETITGVALGGVAGAMIEVLDKKSAKGASQAVTMPRLFTPAL